MSGKYEGGVRDGAMKLQYVPQTRLETRAELRAELEAAQEEIAALRSEVAELEATVERSGFDPLTGLEDSRRKIEEIDRIIYAHGRRREKSAVCVMLVDIDNFKSINDTHGHHAGDEILQHVGVFLKQKVRRTLDRVQRHGGDEFLIVFSGTTALEVVERFRDPTNRKRQPRLDLEAWITRRNSAGEAVGELSVAVHLSAGLADCDLSKDPALARVEAVVRADKAMYDSKKKGYIVVSREYVPLSERGTS